MEIYSARGWARFAPTDLVDRLHRELTSALSAFAQDPRRIELVKEACRQSVIEFVLRWLDGMPLRQEITSIQVRLAGETEFPPLQLSGDSQIQFLNSPEDH